VHEERLDARPVEMTGERGITLATEHDVHVHSPVRDLPCSGQLTGLLVLRDDVRARVTGGHVAEGARIDSPDQGHDG
jgi:hypothetical protein